MGENSSALKECKEFYPDGQIRKHEFYRNEKLEGERKEWHENGQLHIQESYQDGKFDGEQKEWYKNGYLKFSGVFRMGRPIVEERLHYDGNLSLHIKETTIWDLSGYLWARNTRYPHVYERKIWYDNGRLRDQERYYEKLDIHLHSSETWHRNGRPKSREFLNDGVKEGEWRTWTLDGSGDVRKFSRGGKVVDHHFTSQKKTTLLAIKRQLLFRLKCRHFPLNEFVIDDLTNFALNM